MLTNTFVGKRVTGKGVGGITSTLAGLTEGLADGQSVVRRSHDLPHMAPPQYLDHLPRIWQVRVHARLMRAMRQSIGAQHSIA